MTKHRDIWIEDECTPEQRREIAGRLELLSFSEVRRLAQQLGSRFVKPESPPTKDDYINILEENYLDDLEREFAQVVAERPSGRPDRRNPDRG